MQKENLEENITNTNENTIIPEEISIIENKKEEIINMGYTESEFIEMSKKNLYRVLEVLEKEIQVEMT